MFDNVVLGYPYEGGLWHLLGCENPFLNGDIPIHTSGYYSTLHGPKPTINKNHAVNISTLFDEILLPPADEYMPDHQLYTTGDIYHNKHLRIRVDLNWDKVHEFEQLANRLLENDEISKSLKNHKILPSEKNEATHFIQRTLSQIALAIENDAMYLAGDGVSAFVRDLWAFVKSDIDISESKDLPAQPFVISSETLNLVGLDWSCKDLDSFAVVRNTKQINEYGSRFREIIRTSSSEDVKEKLLTAMNEAMGYEEVYRKAQAAFETVGVAATAVGAVPGIGTPAALVGLKSVLAAKQVERKIESHRWYLLGSKLREVDLKRTLEKFEK